MSLDDLTDYERRLISGELPSGDSHTYVNARLLAGCYPTDPQGHTLLVGRNARSLVVADMGGCINVGGVQVVDPAHLDALADRLRMNAARLRERAGDREPE